ncbi:hypothetical protein G6F57_011002 [Rhizopus arrhizus]|uniref:NDT80 domain-containing protein n=1 Tax=Rhizopus oryzae TaxID=64495 RepID=A0A9P6X1Y9_RHIOR|nr:hypothetical protein G6F23_006725 [Rhizopus arrhizus]KAG1410445.1 hypothetical protein G6F58_009133 [Rhizopus delemar]KAG0756861.1 hypothetical protein G6F24_010870 [Rhizopus arrhizus]KAG0788181.1 hypothetical protein G6F21_007392 [Rhizopus arrhizus]KAG0799964.1 hypothetical protein G6F22_002703 [Rhizopus arrhizus]
MNSTHNTKEWQMSQASLQHSILTESPVTHHQSPQVSAHYSVDHHHHYPQPYSQGPMHPPIHHQPPPTTNFLSHGKTDSDPRLPGMMALSQPSTPRPGPHSPPTSKKSHSNYNPNNSYNPYAHPVLARKRGRSELFSAELGPFFSSTKPFDNLYSIDRSTLLTVRIQAKMDRGFFLADNDWTCYRRNYFQVSGAFSIHGLNHYYADQETQCYVQLDGVFHPVLHFSMCISARVSNSDKKIDLVQHTPKRDKGPQTTPNPKPIMPGGNLNMSSVGANQSIVTFERIQFKTATANNGKRRAAQQYYVCLVDLFAEIEGNQRVKVASCQSAPLVVRGRSPGHYSDNQERYEGPISIAPPPPPPQDDRFSAPFPRPPMTPPGVIGSEYGSPYPYPPYPGYSPFNSINGPMQSGMMVGSTPPTPTSGPSQQTGPYMVPSMTTDPSSSESSSPDLYQNEFNHGNGPSGTTITDDHKVAPPPSQGMLPISDDWARHRINSVGHIQSPYQEHNSYFSQPPPSQPYTNNSSAPSTPYGPPRKQILETTENKRLISIIDHVDFLNDFLIQLSQELKQIPTATECAKRYPAIGPLLTLASTHPYLGYSPNLAHNLITCLMDYSKLDSSLIENTNSLSLPTLERSALWCIIRLRRFLVVNQDDTTTDRLISQILETIKSKQNHLCTETIAPLVDKCIALVHQKSLSPVIELVVKCALSEDDEVDPIHFDLKKPLFSDRFIYHLSQSDSIHHRSTLRDHYQCWSKDIQIKILNQIDDFLEMEVLCLIETFTQSYRYMNPDEISNQLKKENLVKLAQSSTRLSEKLIQKVSSYVDLFQDWRIVRLVQCLHPCLSIKLYKQCDSEKYTIKNSAKIAQRVYNLLSDHIYCGPVQDIPQRRTMAWCISMSLPRLLWYCVNGIINWCKNNELWTEEVHV